MNACLVRWIWTCGLAFLNPACGGGDEGSGGISGGAGESCTKTADCKSALKCVNLVCQQAGADCPGDKDCSGMECGPDPVCGESCGSCDSDKTCEGGQCVEGNSPATGGTWTDPISGLTWQVTPPSGPHKWYYWDEAKSYCASLSLGGHSDWRLPTIGELRTLIRGCLATEDGGTCNVEEGDCLAWSCQDDSCSGCSGDGPGSGGMYWPDEIEGDCCLYWSSSPVEYPFDDFVWLVLFSYGSVDMNVGNGIHAVRCVR